jgi:hypothetical protein
MSDYPESTTNHLPPEDELPSGVHELPAAEPRAELVAHLSRMGDLGTLAAACEAGRMISRYRDGADRGAAPKPGVVRASSFRQLARLEGMPMSPASLCRAVSIYHLTLRMPELLTFRRVGIGHVSTVLRLDEEVQVDLLYRAEREGWSRTQLQAVVDERDAVRAPVAVGAL